MIRMKAPKGATFISHGGKTIQVIDGFVEVSTDAARVLISHGYVIAAEEPIIEEQGKFKAKAKNKNDAPVSEEIPAQV